jgi:hypothetical protein
VTELSEVAQAMVDKLKDSPLDFAEVSFGEENLVPRMPAAMVEPQVKRSELYKTGKRTEDTFDLSITILHGRYDDRSITRHDTLEMAEDVKDELHKDTSLGGLVVFGFVNMIEPGFDERAKHLFHATRLTWTAKAIGVVNA